MKRLIFLLIVLSLTLISIGCPRYATIREFSREQLEAQKGMQKTLNSYMKSMEEFAENHAIVSKLYLDDLAEAEQNRLKRLAVRQLNANPAPDQAARDQINLKLGSDLRDNAVKNEQDKKEIDNRISSLKAKHNEIRDAYQTIIESQEQINNYVQLKKADEVVVEQLLGRIRVNQQSIVRYIDEAAVIVDRIRVRPAPRTNPTD